MCMPSTGDNVAWEQWFPEDIVDTILTGSAGKRLGYLDFNAILRCVVGNEREVEFTRRRASGND